MTLEQLIFVLRNELSGPFMVADPEVRESSFGYGDNFIGVVFVFVHRNQRREVKRIIKRSREFMAMGTRIESIFVAHDKIENEMAWLTWPERVKMWFPRKRH